MDNIKIFVVSHSEEDIKNIRKDDVYTPLFVGRNGRKTFGFNSDDSIEDNISSKNKDYCELTGLYWMWKSHPADIIGLCHYRRYFKSDSGKLIEKEDIIQYLKDYDLIMPRKSELIKGSYWETYKDHYLLNSLYITQDIIEKHYPEYLETFNNLLSKGKFSNYNMFIAPREIIDDYCSWLFPILAEVESRINVDENPRVFGLISEAIFNVWVEFNQLNVKECDIYYLGNALKFRMAMSNNVILRKAYRFLYFNFFRNPIGKSIEKFIHKLFY